MSTSSPNHEPSFPQTPEKPPQFAFRNLFEGGPVVLGRVGVDLELNEDGAAPEVINPTIAKPSPEDTQKPTNLNQ